MQNSSPPISLGQGNYFLYLGKRADLQSYFNSPEGKSYLRSVLPAGKVIKIWCPEDNNHILALEIKNVGVIQQ